jgi:hypothetical protein
MDKLNKNNKIYKEGFKTGYQKALTDAIKIFEK